MAIKAKVKKFVADLVAGFDVPSVFRGFFVRGANRAIDENDPVWSYLIPICAQIRAHDFASAEAARSH
jgi:hypothetical protein